MSNVWVEKKVQEERVGGNTSLPFYAGLRICIEPEQNLNFEETRFEAVITKNRYFVAGKKTKSKLVQVKTTI